MEGRVESLCIKLSWEIIRIWWSMGALFKGRLYIVFTVAIVQSFAG